MLDLLYFVLETREEQKEEISKLTTNVFESNSDNAQLTDENTTLQADVQKLENSLAVSQVYVSHCLSPSLSHLLSLSLLLLGCLEMIVAG